jgi:hypothetical protein
MSMPRESGAAMAESCSVGADIARGGDACPAGAVAANAREGRTTF